ncbi:quinoprotein amine dehydrogenase [Rugamonas sp. FT107W]|uniref:Quinoprotein amine dehydrogenase n=1 Tax=Duganella vulcania TaxID=2692166 RepID=A0A845HG07_9BURK|nr:quinoprotein amine dehydrogenase [Duganella vulcania]MYN17287.1 quinoprotein amine dehydrogenase [Duganella vulcania]
MLRPVYLLPLLLAALLTGCGGGGGGGAAPDPGTPAVSPALSFNPATVRGTVNAGTSLTLNVIASVARPADFANAGTVVASIVDGNGVLLPTAQLIRDSDTQYHAVLQTAPSLAAGTYTGNLSVRLCRDSGCASQFPGSPMLLPYSLQVVPAGQLTFSATPAVAFNATAHLGGAAPAPVSIAISGEGRTWTASSGAAWLKATPASGSGSGTLSAAFDPAGLAVGEYSTTLTVLASDGQSATLTATLSVQPSGLVTANGVVFNAVNGAPIATQVIPLDTDDKSSASWSAVANAGWLRISPTSGKTPATAVLTVDPSAGALASASYNSSVTLSATGLPARELPVTLNLTPATLSASVNSITLGGTYGRDFSASPSVTLSLNTSTNAWPWTLGTLPAWASATVASGSVNQAGSKTAFKALPIGAPVGASSVLVNATARVNGDQVVAPVLLNINRDKHKLLPSETGVAFSGSPGWTRLTRTLTVQDNYGSFGGMSAASSQPWLVAGVSGNKLTLTADPTPLGSDTLSIATVTLTPLDADASAPEPIRVALWKGTHTPVVNTSTVLTYSNVITDPIRPYAYVHNGGAYVDIYNLYSGLKTGSITGLGASLGDMATSANGDYLFLLNLSSRTLATIDLNTLAVVSQLPVDADATTRLKVIRPNGVEMLVLSAGAAYLTSNGARLTLPLSGGGPLAASGDGKSLLQQQENSAAVQITTLSVDYTALNGGTLYPARIAAASHANTGTLGQDIAVSADGTRIYTASSTPKLCSILNPVDLGVLGYLAAGDGTPNNVKLGSDGRIYCGAAVKTATSDVWVYDTSGKLLNQFKLAGSGKQLLPRQLAVSGDGTILIGITDDGVATIVPVGP